MKGTDLFKASTPERTRRPSMRFVPIELMPFGKYRGYKLNEIPYDYRKWLLNNFEWTAKTETIRQSIRASMR